MRIVAYQKVRHFVVLGVLVGLSFYFATTERLRADDSESALQEWTYFSVTVTINGASASKYYSQAVSVDKASFSARYVDSYCKAAVKAVKATLKDAGVDPSAVNVIVSADAAHGLFDSETAAQNDKTGDKQLTKTAFPVIDQKDFTYVMPNATIAATKPDEQNSTSADSPQPVDKHWGFFTVQAVTKGDSKRHVYISQVLHCPEPENSDVDVIRAQVFKQASADGLTPDADIIWGFSFDCRQAPTVWGQPGKFLPDENSAVELHDKAVAQWKANGDDTRSFNAHPYVQP